MPLVTAHLLRGPTAVPVQAGNTRHPRNLTCSICGESYSVDYESTCTDPDDLAKVLRSAQIVVDMEHADGHRAAKAEVANTIPPSEERARALINEMKSKLGALSKAG